MRNSRNNSWRNPCKNTRRSNWKNLGRIFGRISVGIPGGIIERALELTLGSILKGINEFLENLRTIYCEICCNTWKDSCKNIELFLNGSLNKLLEE